MKRVGVFLFTLLFVGALIVIPCFADGGYYNLYLSDSNTTVINNGFGVDFDYVLVYSDTDVSSFSSSYSSGHAYFTIDSPRPTSGVFRFINNDDESYIVTLHAVSNSTFSANNFIVPANSYFDLNYFRGSVADSELFTFLIVDSIDEVDYSYSVFDGNGLIGTIGNVLGMIFNSSSILLPLFLIGITLSLGFVAIKFLRKVMWGN